MKEFNNYIETFIHMRDLVIQSGYAKSDEFVGCTEDEIAVIEKAVGRLPMAYRAFLIVMGKEGGSFTKEIPHVWNLLKYYREWANEILQEFKSNYQLPKNAFVFSCHHNEASFFLLDEGEDPPVYIFGETDTEPEFQCHNLTELFWTTAQYVLDVQKIVQKNDC